MNNDKCEKCGKAEETIEIHVDCLAAYTQDGTQVLDIIPQIDYLCRECFQQRYPINKLK